MELIDLEEMGVGNYVLVLVLVEGLLRLNLVRHQLALVVGGAVRVGIVLGNSYLEVRLRHVTACLNLLFENILEVLDVLDRVLVHLLSGFGLLLYLELGPELNRLIETLNEFSDLLIRGLESDCHEVEDEFVAEHLHFHYIRVTHAAVLLLEVFEARDMRFVLLFEGDLL